MACPVSCHIDKALNVEFDGGKLRDSSLFLGSFVVRKTRADNRGS